MAQLFPKAFNVLARVSLLGAPLLFAGTGVGLAAFYRSDYTTGAREVVEQPVPFSHKHHVSQLGIGCQYCHTSVEKSQHPGYPPSKTCMNCHQQMWTSADLLEPIRASYKNDKPVAWTKVHNVPDYVYFNHSIHLGKGIGCYSCHGQIDQMNLVFQSKTLLMEWCLACHRQPELHLRPKDEVYNIAWKPEDSGTNPDTGKPWTQLELGTKLKREHQVRDVTIITNCSMCHR